MTHTNLGKQTIEEQLDGPKFSVCFQSMRHKLRLRGIVVPRLIFQQLFRRIGCEGGNTTLLARIVSGMPMDMIN